MNGDLGSMIGAPKTKKSAPSYRRGKWTVEEEAYSNRLITEFKLGLLPLTDGTTLRTFLSKLLNCDPMRISKKFVGQNCIGKQVFRRRQQDLDRLTPEDMERTRQEIAELEKRFLERVAQTNRVQRNERNGGIIPKGGGKLGNYPIESSAAPPWMLPPAEFPTESAMGGGYPYDSMHTRGWTLHSQTSHQAPNSFAYDSQALYNNTPGLSMGLGDMPHNGLSSGHAPSPPGQNDWLHYSTAPPQAMYQQQVYCYPTQENSGYQGHGMHRVTSLEMLRDALGDHVDDISENGRGTTTGSSSFSSSSSSSSFSQHRMASIGQAHNTSIPHNSLSSNTGSRVDRPSVAIPDFDEMDKASSRSGSSREGSDGNGGTSHGSSSDNSQREPRGNYASNNGSISTASVRSTKSRSWNQHQDPSKIAMPNQQVYTALTQPHLHLHEQLHATRGGEESTYSMASTGSVSSAHHQQKQHQPQQQQQHAEQAEQSARSWAPRGPGLTRASSVENFWLLVNNGDLPQPDTNTLTETFAQHGAPPPQSAPSQVQFSGLSQNRVQIAQIPPPPPPQLRDNYAEYQQQMMMEQYRRQMQMQTDAGINMMYDSFSRGDPALGSSNQVTKPLTALSASESFDYSGVAVSGNGKRKAECGSHEDAPIPQKNPPTQNL